MSAHIRVTNTNTHNCNSQCMHTQTHTDTHRHTQTHTDTHKDWARNTFVLLITILCIIWSTASGSKTLRQSFNRRQLWAHTMEPICCSGRTKRR